MFSFFCDILAAASTSRWLFITSLTLCLSFPLAAEVAIDSTSEDVETIEFPADGDKLLLVIPSSHGMTKGLQTLAESLSRAGVEVWLADPFSTWFLPEAPSSLQKIPTAAYASLIAKARAQATATGKRLYLFAFDRGAQHLLEAARQWQAGQPTQVMDGVILLSPDLYIKTPAAGAPGELLPIARATNLPIFLFSTEKSTLALRLADTVTALESGGSDVFTSVLTGVRNRFFFRPDANDQEREMAADFPALILRAMRLSGMYARTRAAAPLPHTQAEVRTGTATGKLLPYRGTLTVQDFTRQDLAGTRHTLSDYRGRVVLLNFWASWCPPCVHEIPSMSQLNTTLADQPFAILAVNLGEERQDIEQFVEQHPINFPVLLDPGQRLPRDWKVFAFPTSYILDKQGRVRYSVAGAIDWNDAAVRGAVEGLIGEPGQ